MNTGVTTSNLLHEVSKALIESKKVQEHIRRSSSDCRQHVAVSESIGNFDLINMNEDTNTSSRNSKLNKLRLLHSQAGSEDRAHDMKSWVPPVVNNNPPVLLEVSKLNRGGTVTITSNVKSSNNDYSTECNLHDSELSDKNIFNDMPSLESLLHDNAEDVMKFVNSESASQELSQDISYNKSEHISNNTPEVIRDELQGQDGLKVNKELIELLLEAGVENSIISDLAWLLITEEKDGTDVLPKHCIDATHELLPIDNQMNTIADAKYGNAEDKGDLSILETGANTFEGVSTISDIRNNLSQHNTILAHEDTPVGHIHTRDTVLVVKEEKGVQVSNENATANSFPAMDVIVEDDGNKVHVPFFPPDDVLASNDNNVWIHEVDISMSHIDTENIIMYKPVTNSHNTNSKVVNSSIPRCMAQQV